MASEVSLPQSRAPMARESKRAEAAAADHNLEKERQAMLHGKNAEIDTLAKAGEQHRQQVDDSLAQRKVILDEMRAVRDKMHSKLRSARVKGRNDTGEANRSLARAGQRALDKHMEAEQWIAQADAQEARSRAVIASANDSVARVTDVCSVRTSEARSHASRRIGNGQAITNEHALNHEAFRERHLDQCIAQERDAMSIAQLRSGGARRGQQESAWQVRRAMDDSVKVQNSSVQLIQSSRKASENKVATAQQELDKKKRECQAVIDRELICHAQSKNIAAEMMLQDDIARSVELQKLERKLGQVNAHGNNTVTVAEEEEAPTVELNVTWESMNGISLEAARSHAAVQEAEAEQRVNEGKVLLANLQAKCVAYIRELTEQWEVAKRADAEKISVAERRMEDLVQKCAEAIQINNLQCLEIISSTEDAAIAKKSQLQDRHAMIDDLAKQRVSMMQNQARERRQQAEQRLTALRKHTKDVQAACEIRVRTEEETAQEKVQIARSRFEENLQRAQDRTQEAESRRDSARAAYEAVMARCRGATLEARRRGLTNIAEILEPPRQQYQRVAPPPTSSQPQSPSEAPLYIEGERPDASRAEGEWDAAMGTKGFNMSGSTILPGGGDGSWSQDGASTRPGTRGTTGTTTRPGTVAA